MKGIERILIKSTWNNERLKMSRELATEADLIYFDLFANIGMPLIDGATTTTCTKDEAKSRYDYQEGIDVILRFENGHKATLQEKFMDYWQSTLTFTECQKNNVPGSWYTCTAQYWFAGYVSGYWKYGIRKFNDWMLVDYPLLHRLDATTKLFWVFKTNNNPSYEGIDFRYLHFDDVPESVIVARREGTLRRKSLQQLGLHI
jgi:hypothetical protein